MGAASHLGIQLREYDARIRTFVPYYEEMLDVAAGALAAIARRRPVIVDLGVGSGALAARCLRAIPGARLVGVDSDEGMLGLARQRLGPPLTTVAGDFQKAPLPTADAIVASLAFHHVPTAAAKRALYRRCFKALRPGGGLITADCCVNERPRLQARDRATWRAHLMRRYSAAAADKYLRAWAREDVYLPLPLEIDLLRAAGFGVDVAWRRASFAVIVAVRPNS